MSRRWWPLPVVLTLLAVVALAAAPAWAHVSLVSSSPDDGARLTSPPTEVVLEFSADISAPAYVVVTAPDGSRPATGPAEVDGAVVTQALTGTTVTGAYAIAYRAVSVDGHAITGEIGFEVAGAGGRTTPEAGAPTTGAPTAAPGSAPGTTSATEPAGGSRSGLAVGVAVGLFGASALLLLLARRTDEGATPAPRARSSPRRP